MRKTMDKTVVRVAAAHPYTAGWIAVCVIVLLFVLLTREVLA